MSSGETKREFGLQAASGGVYCEGGATHVGKLSTYVSLNFIYAKILLWLLAKNIQKSYLLYKKI